jgi:hypothetical protein
METTLVRAQGDEELDVNEQIWKELENVDGDGTAAQEMLTVGIPIYYVDETTPDGFFIKEYPDGRRELV